jgi:hypothetical protein
MNGRTTFRSARRAFLSCIVAVAAAAALAGCSEIESPTVEGYEPATLESAGPDGPITITVTEEAEHRLELQTSVIMARGNDLVVDYTALIYDKVGKPFVFTVVEPHRYVRANVGIKGIVDNQVTLTSGPPAGTQVVTVGAVELWGAELGIAGKH